MRLTSHRPRAAVAFFAVAILLAACATPGSGSPAASTGGGISVTVSHTGAGDSLAGPNGMTLYILTKDNGSSTCTSGQCAATWPALKGDGSTVTAGTGVTGAFGTTTWADGTKQVTHNGQPLYYYSGDSAAGDANGEGSGGVWFIAPVGSSPHGASSSQAAGASATAKPSFGVGY